MHGRYYTCNDRCAPHRFTLDGRIECLLCGADVETGQRAPEPVGLPLWECYTATAPLEGEVQDARNRE
jgi:hypothetical protein